MEAYKKMMGFLRLQDPTWQAIGAIITLIAIIVSTLVAYDIYNRANPIARMIIREHYDFNPFSFSDNMRERLTLLLDGRELDSIRVHIYTVSNAGRHPIRPSDFVKPIQVTVDEPWELLAVDSDWSWPPDLQVEWKQVLTNTFEMEPLLLNEDDAFEVVLFLTNPEDPEDSQELPELTWNVRIVNLSTPDIRRRGEESPETLFGLLSVRVEHSGWGVYFWAALAASFIIVSVWIGEDAGRLDPPGLKRTILLIAIAMFSFATAEILADVFVDGDYDQWLGIYPILSLHAILVFYLAWPLILQLLRRGIAACIGKGPDSSDET